MAISPLQIVGPYRDRCGAGEHVRLLAAELIAAGIDVRLLRLPAGHALADEALPPALRGRDGLCRADVALHFSTPSRVTTAVRPDAKHVNYVTSEPAAMCETAPLLPAWVERARRLPLTLVPCERARRVWLESGAPEDRVAASPLGVETERFRPDVAPLAIADPSGRLVAHYTHRVLAAATSSDHKNLAGLVRAWSAATTRRDDAVLILLLTEVVPERLQQIFAETRPRAAEVPAPIVVITSEVPPETLPQLFAAATSYVSASRGEAWDDALLRAAATGLSLIAPRHTMYADVLDDGVATLIPAARAPATVQGPAGDLFGDLSGHAAARERPTWWEPDFDALVAALAGLVRGPAARAARQPHVREKVALKHTWQKAGERLRARLEVIA